MKALVGAFNQEKALVGAFSVIMKTGCGTDGALHSTIVSIQHPQMDILGGEQRGSDGCWCRAFQAEINKKISHKVEPLPREELSFIFLQKSLAMVVTTSCTLPH